MEDKRNKKNMFYVYRAHIFFTFLDSSSPTVCFENRQDLLVTLDRAASWSCEFTSPSPVTSPCSSAPSPVAQVRETQDGSVSRS